MKKAIACFAALAVTFSAGAAFARTATAPTCPIQKEKVAKIDPALTSVYKGKKFFFCCGGCKPAFDKMSDADKVALMKYGVDIKKPTVVKKPATVAPVAAAKKPA